MRPAHPRLPLGLPPAAAQPSVTHRSHWRVARGRAILPYMWRWVAAVGVGMCCYFLGEGSAKASSADELLASARRLELAHDDELAARRYNEALALDGSLSEAWLALGALRTRQGDHREAERVYAVCVARLPGLQAARLAHAESLHALGRTDEAVNEIETLARAVPRERRRVALWYSEEGRFPAALAMWRLVLARAVVDHDDETVAEARSMVRALVLVAKPFDPAAYPAGDSRVRQMLGRIARNGGV